MWCASERFSAYSGGTFETRAGDVNRPHSNPTKGVGPFICVCTSVLLQNPAHGLPLIRMRSFIRRWWPEGALKKPGVKRARTKSNQLVEDTRSEDELLIFRMDVGQ